MKIDKLDIESIFGYWRNKSGKPHASLDFVRREKIEARLRDGYSVEDCFRAISGCYKTRWNMGHNDRGAIYDELTLILRDRIQMDRFTKNDKYNKFIGVKRLV